MASIVANTGPAAINKRASPKNCQLDALIISRSRLPEEASLKTDNEPIYCESKLLHGYYGNKIMIDSISALGTASSTRAAIRDTIIDKASSGNAAARPRRCLFGARLLLLLNTLPVRHTHDHEDTEQQLPGGPAAGRRRGDRAARGEPPGQARLRVHLQQDLRRQQRVPHDADRREGHRQGRGLRGHRGRRSRPHLRHARLHHTQVHGHALPRHNQGQEAALQKDTLRPGLLR
ncbi:unnamed protein product [Trichogramma brassicae]|uniref:Uncharacterized protein n=1 Tax=Trichogramma brassicae TaxID=86971 RepID=A0A6H5IWD8_9HYME|nr:unnamed protein product [Trichogramma brassicae]